MSAICRWDASGLFADLLLAESTDVVVSPRMLALLYAADLCSGCDGRFSRPWRQGGW